MGGNYRLCYSANGTFGLLQADITPGPRSRVPGIQTLGREGCMKGLEVRIVGFSVWGLGFRGLEFRT